MMKQFEEQQANIAGLVGRVDETQEAVVSFKNFFFHTSKEILIA